MSKVFIEESTLSAIGDSIRAKTGKPDLIGPLDMASEIASIQCGGGDAIIKTVSGACPVTLEDCMEGSLLDYKIYGNFSDTVYYGSNNEYLRYDYITMDQVAGENKAGFNSGIKWSQVNRIRLKIRHPGTDDNDIIFAAKPNAENAVASLTNPWINIGKKAFNAYNISSFTSDTPVVSGEFNIANLTFTLPTSSNYIFIGIWNNSAYIKSNDFGFIEFYYDDDLVAAFYPAQRVSDGVFGFYNTLSGGFITCNANANAFVGNMPEGDSVGDFCGSSYIIPMKINSQTVNISLPYQLTTGDCIDFENRVVVKDGNKTYMEFPEMLLDGGSNIIDVDTTVKPSSVSLTYVKSVEFNTMKTVEGAPPLVFDGVGQKLENYRIYGAEGGVGIPTRNLFNKNAKDTNNGYFSGGFITKDNSKTSNGSFAVSEYIPVKPNTSYYLDSRYAGSTNPSICWYDENKTLISGVAVSPAGIKTSPDGAAYCRTSYVVASADSVILAESAEVIPYEPYGSTISIVVNGAVYTTPPIPYFLEDGDYLDFENRVTVKDGVASYLDLPEIYTENGENIIDVDSSVKPSKVSVSYIDDSSIVTHRCNFPIELKDNGKVLLDYTIYGNSNGVGDKTKNLIRWYVYDDGNKTVSTIDRLKELIADGYTIIWSLSNTASTGVLSYNQSNTYMLVQEIQPNTTYTMRGYTKNVVWEYDADLTPLQSVGSGINKSSFTFTSSENAKYLMAYIYNRAQSSTQQPYTLEQIHSFQQLELGESATEFEPYGYKISLMSTIGEDSIETKIFMDTMLGDGEYLNYRAQAIVRNGVKEDCDLPVVVLPGNSCVIDVAGTNKPMQIDIVY